MTGYPPAVPPVVDAHQVQVDDFICLDPSEIGTGGWQVLAVRRVLEEVHLEVLRDGDVMGELRMPYGKPVIVTDGMDYRLGLGHALMDSKTYRPPGGVPAYPPF